MIQVRTDCIESFGEPYSLTFRCFHHQQPAVPFSFLHSWDTGCFSRCADRVLMVRCGTGGTAKDRLQRVCGRLGCLTLRPFPCHPTLHGCQFWSPLWNQQV